MRLERVELLKFSPLTPHTGGVTKITSSSSMGSNIRDLQICNKRKRKESKDCKATPHRSEWSDSDDDDIDESKDCKATPHRSEWSDSDDDDIDDVLFEALERSLARMSARRNERTVEIEIKINECSAILIGMEGLDHVVRLKACMELQSASMQALFLIMTNEDRLCWVNSL
ncbi:hypothetical protein ABFS82_10G121600 [Erythranthe guttata]